MHPSSVLAFLALALSGSVSAAPFASPAPSLADTSSNTLHKSLLAAHSVVKRNGAICNIAHGDADCAGASGDAVNTNCECLYLIPGVFPNPGIWVYTCQPPGNGQC